MYMDETFRLKVGLAEMLKGGVIMETTNAEQAGHCEKAGACAVMALEKRVLADFGKEGGVARMAPIGKIREIMHQVSIAVHGESQNRPLHGGADFGSAGGGLHRRERSAARRPTKSTISTNAGSRFPSCAVRAIWARRCGGSPKARP